MSATLDFLRYHISILIMAYDSPINSFVGPHDNINCPTEEVIFLPHAGIDRRPLAQTDGDPR